MKTINLEQILKDYIGIYHDPVHTHTMKVQDVLAVMKIACEQSIDVAIENANLSLIPDGSCNYITTEVTINTKNQIV